MRFIKVLERWSKRAVSYSRWKGGTWGRRERVDFGSARSSCCLRINIFIF